VVAGVAGVAAAVGVATNSAGVLLVAGGGEARSSVTKVWEGVDPFAGV
jgi:hypothetical protein